MCGICGKICLDGQIVDRRLIERMCRALTHRGPDDAGVYLQNGDDGQAAVNIGLGHRRLSIIDLSPMGRQPMSNEDGTVWIAFNGEIYNYKPLRKTLEQKGHRFKSDTDTEVIVHLYEEKGVDAVRELNGMFAFALWDRAAARIWLCRDRIGIKPLVYTWNGSSLTFASEIKALLCDRSIPKELDDEALYLYLAFNYVPAPHTMFTGIRKLLPGHSLILEEGRVEVNRYWDVPIQETKDRPARDDRCDITALQAELKKALDDAVRLRMAADVPLGAFLSGGIDSSIIVALMARASARSVKTFSIGFADDGMFDETRYARGVADMYRTDHREFKLTARDMLDVFPSVLDCFDEPFADSSAIPTFIVSRETRNHVTVALSGDGGDELFAGYRSYLGQYWHRRYMMIPAVIRNGVIERLAAALPDARDNPVLEYARRLKKFVKGAHGSFSHRVLALKEIFPADLRRRIAAQSNPKAGGNPGVDPALALTRGLLEAWPGDAINQMLYADVKDSLPCDMLTKVDWMSMKNSLEVRVPFLDHRVVALSFKIPGSLKLRRATTKRVLKETFKDLLPPGLLRRPKAGFEIPISRWLRTDLRFLMERYLNEERIRSHNIFDFSVIAELQNQFFTRKTDTAWMLWNLIVFEYWYERYFQ